MKFIKFIFIRFKNEKLNDEKPSPLFQINKTQSRIRCCHIQNKSNTSARKRIRCTLTPCDWSRKGRHVAINLSKPIEVNMNAIQDNVTAHTYVKRLQPKASRTHSPKATNRISFVIIQSNLLRLDRRWTRCCSYSV